MIDAHQHCWQIGQHGCTWPVPELAKIYRDFSPNDLLGIARAAGVTGSVLVQSQACDADTDYLLALAAQTDFIKAVVGWVDLASTSAPQRIAVLAQHPKMRGVRPMLQGLADDQWLLKPELEPAIAALIAHNLSLDGLIFPRHLPYLHTFAQRHPQLPIVIDHAAKPAIARHEFGHEFNRWADSIAAIATLPQVMCKLSGLLTEASSQQGIATFAPYVQHLYRVFGAERLMWGSDWPVLHLAPNQHYTTYSEWLALAKALLPMVSAAELEFIFAQTTRRFYRL
jgi:L-fuconolactonase